MVQGHPYYGLGGRREGRVGPASKMTTTLAAYAPNFPWLRIGCSNAVNTGGGVTSAATPQSAVGRQLRRTAKRGIQIRCVVAVFGWLKRRCQCNS